VTASAGMIGFFDYQFYFVSPYRERTEIKRENEKVNPSIAGEPLSRIGWGLEMFRGQRSSWARMERAQAV